LPRIPPKILNCVFYLYHSVEDANAGTNFGGSGFFVGLRSEISGRYYQYAVTNWHVACRDGASIIRVNNVDGSTDTFSAGPEEWEFLPQFDVAVIPCNLTKQQIFSMIILPSAGVTKESIEKHSLGPGEDVFMVGRFVDHDGGPTNRPAVRFGNISVMPAPIQQSNGMKADSYCIDLHSRTGFSGSPIFVYRTPGYNLEDHPTPEFGDDTVILTGGAYVSLLGIHYAQFPEIWELKHGALPNEESGSVPLIREGAYVKGMSGMTCALPVWSILEVLNMPKLKKAREDNDAKMLAEMAAKGDAAPDAESISPPATDANPTHREDFKRLVGAAARKPEPKD
jgi:hypothetical protein